MVTLLFNYIFCVSIIFGYGLSFGGRPETVQNLYQVETNFKLKSIGIKESLEEIAELKDYLHHWKPPGELNLEFFEIYPKCVYYGNYISPLDCLEPPTEIEFVSFFPLVEKFVNELYTLVLDGIGEDGIETCHAIWVNIPFNDENYEIIEHLNAEKKSFITKFNLRDAKDLMKYYGPRPEHGTGTHQYVFILFRQPHGWFPPHKLKFRENWGSKHPDHHGVVSWANYYTLQPIGVNFFTSSNEDLF